MFWFVLIGFLGAFGALCIFWVLIGLFLFDRTPCHVVILCPPKREIEIIRLFCYFRGLGLIRSELTLLDSALNTHQKQNIHNRHSYIHFTSCQEWLQTRGMEGLSIAGTGDFTRYDYSGSISKL